MKGFSLAGSSRFAAPLRTPPAAQVVDAPAFYQIGDTVMHPNEGICTIEELRSMHFKDTQSRMYYILKPSTEKSSSTVYMPVSLGNTILRRLLSRADILDLIHRSADHAGLWIADSKQRKDTFSHILSEGNYAKIIRMIQEIHLENAKRVAEGKKPCASDEALCAQAERLLHQEFSYVLHMSVEDTIAFICRELNIP